MGILTSDGKVIHTLTDAEVMRRSKRYRIAEQAKRVKQDREKEFAYVMKKLRYNQEYANSVHSVVNPLRIQSIERNGNRILVAVNRECGDLSDGDRTGIETGTLLTITKIVRAERGSIIEYGLASEEDYK